MSVLDLSGELAGERWQLRLRDGVLSGEPGVVRVLEDAVAEGDLVQIGVTGHTVPLSLDYPLTVLAWLSQHPAVTLRTVDGDADLELALPDDAVS